MAKYTFQVRQGGICVVGDGNQSYYAEKCTPEQAKKAYALLRSLLPNKNICEPKDIAEILGETYLITRYQDARTLNYIMDHKPLPKTQITLALIDAADVLAQLHKRGIAHCNINPRTIQVRKDSEKNYLSSGILSGFVYATPYGQPIPETELNPPEQNTATASPSTDIFQFAKTIFATLKKTVDTGIIKGEQKPVQLEGLLGETLTQALNPEPTQRPTLPKMKEAIMSMISEELKIQRLLAQITAK